MWTVMINTDNGDDNLNYIIDVASERFLPRKINHHTKEVTFVLTFLR